MVFSWELDWRPIPHEYNAAVRRQERGEVWTEFYTELHITMNICLISMDVRRNTV